MQLPRGTIKRAAAIFALAASVAVTATPALATGTLTIQKNGSAAKTYTEVEIRVLYGALFLTSEDGKGTLVFPKAACSYQGKIFVCYVTGATLVQEGEATPLDLKTGTVYFNSTSEPQQLSSSTRKIPPNGILLAVTTERGTYIGLTGLMDQVVKS